MRSLRTVALMSSLAVVANRCSMIFVRPPRPGGGAGPGGCTKTKVAPVLDTAFAGWQAARIVIAATASEDTYKGAALTREADLLLGVLLGIVGASSALYGFRAVNECRDAGEYTSPYAPREKPRTSQQRAAEEAAEEAAVKARLKARAAESANAAEEDDDAPTVTPAATAHPDAGM